MSGHKRNGFPHRNTNEREDKTEQLIDDLAEFERYRQEVLSEIRKDIESGLTTAQLIKKYDRLAIARIITTALTDTDSARAVAAAKDVVDRAQGKPRERKEITHQFSELPESELDALIKSKLTQLEEDDDIDSSSGPNGPN